jgi:hypothetical protein
LAERQHAKLGKSKNEQPAESTRKVYESDTNLLTETDEGKPLRTASQASWNTVDINEDSLSKMKVSSYSMASVITFNILISLSVCALSLECEYSSDRVQQCSSDQRKFGFGTYG